MKRIFQAHLRTLDVDAAREFYRSVLGAEPTRVVRLHEKALARGARPHWLGYIDVGDVEAAAAQFLARGATALAPIWVDPEGLQAAVMRDPGGAIIALAKPPSSQAETAAQGAVPELVFQSLNTNDVASAIATYRDLFGWSFDAPLDLGRLGLFHPFRWEATGPSVGVFGDIAARPEVHPHWTFHFRVPALDAAIARVLSGGGLALDPIELPGGARIAVCDDPQGATFALQETR